MKLDIIVSTKKRHHSFRFYLNKASAPQCQNIDEEFYLQANQQLHEDLHYEARIVTEEIVNHPFMKKEENPLHVHCSAKDGKYYVKWSNHIPTVEDASRIIQCWCLGTAYTLDYDMDYVRLLDLYYIGADEFSRVEEIFNSQFNIKVISSKNNKE